MRKIQVSCFLMALSFLAVAQGNEPVQRSSSPSGLKINDAAQTEGVVVWNSGVPSSNEPDKTNITSQQSSGKSAIPIQGNTAIKASARNLNSVATGRNSAAGNEVGTVGK